MTNSDMTGATDFAGSKLALFLGPELVVILRDDKPDIPWPGHWDFPGGGREGAESPLDCALRETSEEIGLALTPEQVSWGTSYLRPHGRVWFFAAHQPAWRVDDLRLGDEGQEWRLMSPETYCNHPLAVPHFAEQLSQYLAYLQGN